MKKLTRFFSALLSVLMVVSVTSVFNVTTFAADSEQTAVSSDDKLTVRANSNIFPTVTQEFSPDTNQITVTWWICANDIVMVNTQNVITYDSEKLSVDMTEGVNGEMTNVGGSQKRVEKILRVTDGYGTVTNYSPKQRYLDKHENHPDSLPFLPGEENNKAGIKLNAINVEGWKLSDSGDRVPFASVTFNPKTAGGGSTDVNLYVEIIQYAEEGETDNHYFVAYSEIADSGISYLPEKPAAVYAGGFDNNYGKEQPTTAQPTTAAPTTAKPTAAPTTAKPTVAPTTAKPTVAPTTAKPTVAPTTAKPTVAPTTAKPTVAPTTAKPTVAPTTAKPTTAPATAAENLSLEVKTVVNEFSVDLPKSFYFAGKNPTVAKSGDTVTISWKLDNDGRKFESVQWIYTYDPDVMEIISANMPQMTLGDMYNIETPGSVRANASNINGYKSDPEADFIVLTFRVTGGGSATSQMYLQTFANYEAELPTTAEPTEAPATAAPSTVIPTTVPVTAEPTEAPTTAPVTAEPTEAPTTAPAATVQASPEPSKALKEDAEKLGKQVISFEFPADGSWGDPKNLEFDPDTHTVNVYCYPYAVFGNTVEFLVTSWESDSSKCTYTDENDLTFSYDLNSAVISDRVNAETGKNDTVSVYRYIEENPNADYGVIFSTDANGGFRTADVNMTIACVGDTLVLDSPVKTRVNADDPAKADYFAHWKKNNKLTMTVITSEGKLEKAQYPANQPKEQVLSNALVRYLTDPRSNAAFTAENNLALCNSLNVTPEKVYEQFLADAADALENGIPVGAAEGDSPVDYVLYTVTNADGEEIRYKVPSPLAVREALGLSEKLHVHVIVTDKGYAPTCTKAGLTDGSHCADCGEEFEEQKEIPALGHDPEEVKGYPATDESDGLTDGVRCKRCGEWLVEQKVIPRPAVPVMIGDIDGNGRITIEDVTLVQKFIAELETFDQRQTVAADTNGDGMITIEDATMIQKYIAELIDHLGK